MLTDNSQRYIELIKNVLIDYHRIDRIEYKPLYTGSRNVSILIFVNKIFTKLLPKFSICRVSKFTREVREIGHDQPANAESMIGLKRMNNIQFCVETVLKDGIPGDLIETGVWRGGATIFMKALLDAHGVRDRTVWVADSFAGLPPPNTEKYPDDKGEVFHNSNELAVSLEQVRGNFEKYGVLDGNVKFLKGWFKDTLPTAPIDKLAVLRLDGDLYESTMDALSSLYPKLSPGGFLIIDDWNAVFGCKRAVNDYRSKYGITEDIIEIDKDGAFWRKRAT